MTQPAESGNSGPLWQAFAGYLARRATFAALVLILWLPYRFYLEPDAGFSIGVLVLLAIAVFLIRWGLRERADRQALAALVAGTPPVESTWTAVSGIAVPLAPDPGPDMPLSYRFSTIDETRRRSQSGDTTSKHLTTTHDGFYLRPTGLDTGNGIVRLAELPDMIHIDKSPLPGDLLAEARARADLCPRPIPKTVARDYLVAGTSDRIDRTLRYGDAPPSPTGRTDSWVLSEGDRVTVLGRFRDGALHGTRQRPRGMPLYRGNAAEVLERVAGDATAFLVIGCTFAAAALGVAAWSLF